MAAIVIVLLVELELDIVIVGAVRSRLVKVIVPVVEYVPIEVPLQVRPKVNDNDRLMVLVPSDEWLTVCVPLVIVLEPEPPIVVVPLYDVPLMLKL